MPSDACERGSAWAARLEEAGGWLPTVHALANRRRRRPRDAMHFCLCRPTSIQGMEQADRSIAMADTITGVQQEQQGVGAGGAQPPAGTGAALASSSDQPAAAQDNPGSRMQDAQGQACEAMPAQQGSPAAAEPAPPRHLATVQWIAAALEAPAAGEDGAAALRIVKAEQQEPSQQQQNDAQQQQRQQQERQYAAADALARALGIDGPQPAPAAVEEAAGASDVPHRPPSARPVRAAAAQQQAASLAEAVAADSSVPLLVAKSAGVLRGRKPSFLLAQKRALGSGRGVSIVRADVSLIACLQMALCTCMEAEGASRQRAELITMHMTAAYTARPAPPQPVQKATDWLTCCAPPTPLLQYNGVCFDRRKQRWFSQIQQAGRRHFLGYHPNEEAAAEAYDR